MEAKSRKIQKTTTNLLTKNKQKTKKQEQTKTSKKMGKNEHINLKE